MVKKINKKAQIQGIELIGLVKIAAIIIFGYLIIKAILTYT